jgi:hypothetical protein
VGGGEDRRSRLPSMLGVHGDIIEAVREGEADLSYCTLGFSCHPGEPYDELAGVFFLGEFSGEFHICCLSYILSIYLICSYCSTIAFINGSAENF